MHPHPTETPRGLITELRAALDAVPADEPRNYLRQSLQLVVPLLEQLHQRLRALETRLDARESSSRQTDDTSPPTPAGGAMLRKYLLTARPLDRIPEPSEKAIAAIATVWVTSEAADAPIDHVFDQSRGPGGSRWVAAEAGEQQLILAFDTPQTLHTISLEAEEPEVSRTHVLCVSTSSDGGQTYRELRRQEYTFSPPGTTFEREVWAVTVEGVTHLRLIITPDKEGTPCRATLTSLALR